MKLTAFKNLVYGKLFLNLAKDASGKDDAIAYGYAGLVVPLLNEALNLIANSSLALRIAVPVFFKSTMKVDRLPEASSSLYEVTKKVVYDCSDPESYGYWEVQKIENETETGCTYNWITTQLPLMHEMPANVLSVKYADTEVPGATFYVRTNLNGIVSVVVSKPGSYTFICDGVYPTIPEDDKDNAQSVLATIPESIVYVASLYVASQLLFDTDQPRAQMVRNEYEMALARLDTTRQDLQESFSMTERW